MTDHDAVEFIVATEQHIIHQMDKAAPHKTFIAAPGADGTCDCASCPFMAMNSLEKLYLAMVNEAPRVELPEDLRIKALTPLQKMLDMSPAPPPKIVTQPDTVIPSELDETVVHALLDAAITRGCRTG